MDPEKKIEILREALTMARGSLFDFLYSFLEENGESIASMKAESDLFEIDRVLKAVDES